MPSQIYHQPITLVLLLIIIIQFVRPSRSKTTFVFTQYLSSGHRAESSL